MSTPNSLVTEIRRIADLKPYANSPRVHSRDQRHKATSILRRFGQVTPIIIDPDGTIIDGHLVAETLAALGHDEVAVVVQRNRNPGELRALRLALNRLAEKCNAAACSEIDPIRNTFRRLEQHLNGSI